MTISQIEREIRDVQEWAKAQQRTYYLATYARSWHTARQLLAVSQIEYDADPGLNLLAVVYPSGSVERYYRVELAA